MTAAAHRLDDEPIDPAEAEREAVANLTADGHSARAIADIVGDSHDTISRDVANATPIDAVAEMSEAAFAVIQRAHAICDHAPARELSAELEQGCLIPHASKILGAQIRALALSAKAAEKIQNSYKDAAADVLDDFGDDETDEPSVDWAQIAADAWTGASWMTAAEDYHRAERGKCVRQ